MFLAGFGVLFELLFERVVRSYLHVINNPKALKVVIAVLVVTLLTSLGFLVYARSQVFWWQEQVYGLAGYQGSRAHCMIFKMASSGFL